MPVPRLVVIFASIGVAAGPAFAAKPLSDAARLRQEAEHVCYGDVQKLCSDAIPDEDKIKACMAVHHADLSPGCAKVYDRGIDGE